MKNQAATILGSNGLLIVLSLLLAFACEKENANSNSFSPADDPIQYVNPFIGTGGHGHTYPGASYPFGMMQLSPDTRLTGWDGCSGYHYSDSIIYGFSHTHLSGTGVSDYGDVLLMPVNNGATITSAELGYEAFQSTFSHDKEKATAGYYEVYLDRPEVQVALTTTTRCGIHQYSFTNPQSPAVVLDLEHRDEVLSCDFNLVGDRRIEGYRHSKAWAEDQRLFFVIEFSEPITDFHLQPLAGTRSNAKGVFRFAESTEQVLVRTAISAVDLEGARKNFDAEIAGVSFEAAHQQSLEEWRSALNKIKAVALSEDEQTVFYSALYHSMLAPNVYSDVDGRYRGMDQQVYQDEDRTHYTVFSLWDTHRAAHPLFTIIDQERTSDFIHTMLQKYEQGGIIPIWDLSACYTGCMIGYHGVSVIADAYQKGIRDYDAELALAAMVHSADQEHLGLDDYQQLGFIALENEAESVSKTLEYAYDDWCIAQMASALGEEETYQRFLGRSLNYRNIFDPETKFFRPRVQNFWKAPFDPFEVNSNYTEANAWQYGFSAIHDVDGFADLHGGKAQLADALDTLFTVSSSTKGRDQVDITGLIGQYAHGNEPSHHIAYLYNYLDQPWKTQSRVREILNTQYHNEPDGVSGNEDCGQMSAWYILSSMGLYSVLPGSDYYVIGSPSLQSAEIQLENGNVFRVSTTGNSPENIYVHSMTLNGEPYAKGYLLHDDIMAGGTLQFTMGAEPNYELASNEAFAPSSTVDDSELIQVPYIVIGDLSFVDENSITLKAFDEQDEIFYSIDDGQFNAYDPAQPILMTESGNLCIYAQRDGRQSATLCTYFTKRDGSLSIDLKSEYAAIYDGGAPDALIDGLKGGEDYRTGTWQGFEGQHLEYTVTLEEAKTISNISCGFLQDENSWIFFPSMVEFYASSDGENFELVGTVKPTVSPKESGVHLEDMGVTPSGLSAKYIKVKAHSLLKCPSWHKGALYDGKAWVFADEISIQYD